MVFVGLGGLSAFTGVNITCVLPILRKPFNIQCDLLRSGLWGIVVILSFLGALFQCQGGLTWLPIFGTDGLTWSMLLVLAIAGGGICSHREALAYVFLGLGFLMSSPLLFGLLAGTALSLLPGKGWKALCLPFAVLPACIPVDSLLSVFLLCLTIVQTGWAILDQRGTTSVVPVCIGIFLLSRILVEYGYLPLTIQITLLMCCGCVAVGGCFWAFYAQDIEEILCGVVMAWYGCVVSDLLLSLVSTLEGADIFGIAFRLGLGPCFLGLLVLLAVAQWQSSGAYILFKRFFVALGMFQGSVLPSSGGFLMIWSNLEAIGASMTKVKPALAFILLLLATFQCIVITCMTFGLLRVILALLYQNKQETPVKEERFYDRQISFWGCIGGSILFLFLPQIWLFITRPIIAGSMPISPFSWDKNLFVITLPYRETYLIPIVFCLLVGGGFWGVMRLVSLFLWDNRQEESLRIMPLWKQAAPFVEIREKKHDIGLDASGVLPMSVALDSLLGGCLGGRRFIILGLSHGDRLFIRYCRYSLVILRTMRSIIFRSGLWCDRQGVAWILLLLGVGLFIGLFSST
ncbi:MAG: hypothetical protein IIT54_01915 [Acetobacter sp.]|nr:hypothetical protein [Acetobacter sp.]